MSNLKAFESGTKFQSGLSKWVICTNIPSPHRSHLPHASIPANDRLPHVSSHVDTVARGSSPPAVSRSVSLALSLSQLLPSSVAGHRLQVYAAAPGCTRSTCRSSSPTTLNFPQLGICLRYPRLSFRTVWKIIQQGCLILRRGDLESEISWVNSLRLIRHPLFGCQTLKLI